MDILDFLKRLVDVRDERAIVIAEALLDVAKGGRVELPDWVFALAGLTDTEYLDVIDDFIRAEEETVS